MKDLEYGKVYDLRIADKIYQGIYLGQKNVTGKFSLNHIIFVNYTYRLKKGALFRFKDFRFENNKLIMVQGYRTYIPKNQRFFYENLLETKLKD